MTSKKRPPVSLEIRCRTFLPSGVRLLLRVSTTAARISAASGISAAADIPCRRDGPCAGAAEALVPVSIGVGIQNGIHQGVGLLGCLDGAVQADLAADVNAIGQENERLAAVLLAHQLIGREKNRVIQCGTSAAVSTASTPLA